MKETRPSHWQKAITALMATQNAAIVYFTRRDLLGEAVDSILTVWALPEPGKILRKQSQDGSWAGPVKKTPVYPANHASLVATFKVFRTLVEFGAQPEILIEDGDAPRVVCAAAQRIGADVLVIGRGSAAGMFGRLRTNAYAIIRQSPCPVISV